MSIEVQPVATRAAQPAPTRRSMPALLALIVSLGLLVGGIGTAAFLVKTKKTPAKKPEKVVAPLVEVVSAEHTTRPITLNLNGTVMAARRVVVMSEVPGRIVWSSDKLVPGGFVKKGEQLLRIDGRDYALAIRQQQAQLKNQQIALQVEAARREVATKEWELFQQERRAAGLPAVSASAAPPLAVRAPQLAGAQVNVAAARSALSRARLTLGKTSLKSPFNAFVQMENIENGQLVAPQSQLATLVGTDNFWVQVSVPLDRLGYVHIPGTAGVPLTDEGSAAVISLDTGRGLIRRSGHVIRLLGDLDPVGRMARLLVQVPDPFGMKEETHESGGAGNGAKDAVKDDSAAEGGEPMRSRLPLLLGSYVHVEIKGEQLQQVIELPRRALQPGNQVFLLDGDDKLRIIKVQPLWSTDDTVLLRGGLDDSARVIVTPLPAAVEGMQLRTGDASSDALGSAPDSAAPDSAAPDSAAPDSAAPDSAAPDSAAAAPAAPADKADGPKEKTP